MVNYRRVGRKVARKVGQAVKGRYFKGKGYSRPKVGQMIKDVAMLKSMINSEKKRLSLNSGNTPRYVSQVNANASGHYLADITPAPTQGTTFDGVIGNSFKWVSSHLKFQFQGQASTTQGMRIKMYFVQVVGLPYSTVSDVMDKFITPNPFIAGASVYDMVSERNPDYFKNFRVVRTKTVYIRPDDFTTQANVQNVTVGLKFKNFHIRKSQDDPTLSHGQVFLLMVADNGNQDTGTACTLDDVPVTAVATAVTFRWSYTHYFYDN